MLRPKVGTGMPFLLADLPAVRGHDLHACLLNASWMFGEAETSAP
jgi:hypothetical protein